MEIHISIARSRVRNAAPKKRDNINVPVSQEKVRRLPVGVALPNAEYERQLVPLVQNIYTGHSEVWSKPNSYIF